jgi:hypothetical protein
MKPITPTRCDTIFFCIFNFSAMVLLYREVSIQSTAGAFYKNRGLREKSPDPAAGAAGRKDSEK